MGGVRPRLFPRLQAENGVSMFAHRSWHVFQGFDATQADGGSLTCRHAFEQKLGHDERDWTDILSYVKKEINIPYYTVFRNIIHDSLE